MLHISRVNFVEENKVRNQTIKLGPAMLSLVMGVLRRTLTSKR